MIESGSRTDTGLVRQSNEDSFGSLPDLDLFVLSDGMGGLEFGEVASRLAVETILDHCREAKTDPKLPLNGTPIHGVSDVSNRLVSAIRLANLAIHREAQRGNGSGMGATVVAVQFAGERMSLAHVGDSRAYRTQGRDIEQLTHDHAFVAEQVRQGNMTDEEASASKLQNVLIRALGVAPEVEVDITEELVTENDTVLLCSDGLTRELSNAQIAAVLREEEDPQEAANRLVALANQAGGGDNITAMVLRSAQRPVGAFACISRMGRWFKGH